MNANTIPGYCIAQTVIKLEVTIQSHSKLYSHLDRYT